MLTVLPLIMPASARSLRQHEPEKFAQRKRIGRPPRDRVLGIQAFEVADRQQPNVAPGRHPGSTDLVGIEPLTECFDVPVEVMFVEDLIQPRVRRMRSGSVDP
jgi:hypothetical protein